MQIDGKGILEMSYGSVRTDLYGQQTSSPSLTVIFLLFPSCSNLMAPDEFKNLGFSEDDKPEAIPNHAGGATAHKVRDDGKKIS